MDWLILAAEVAEAAPVAANGVSKGELFGALAVLAGVVGLLWKLNEGKTTKQIDDAEKRAKDKAEEAKQLAVDAQKRCEEEKTNLIKRLDEKDEKIETLHQERKKDTQDFTETLGRIRCLHVSGEHPAVKGNGR